MESAELKDLVMDALDDLKGVNIVDLDVQGLTDVMDFLVITSGTSNRHVKALAENVSMEAKQAGERPLGVEGQVGSESMFPPISSGYK